MQVRCGGESRQATSEGGTNLGLDDAAVERGHVNKSRRKQATEGVSVASTEQHKRPDKRLGCLPRCVSSVALTRDPGTSPGVTMDERVRGRAGSWGLPTLCPCANRRPQQQHQPRAQGRLVNGSCSRVVAAFKQKTPTVHVVAVVLTVFIPPINPFEFTARLPPRLPLRMDSFRPRRPCCYCCRSRRGCS
jgi:hypothetical protein